MNRFVPPPLRPQLECHRLRRNRHNEKMRHHSGFCCDASPTRLSQGPSGVSSPTAARFTLRNCGHKKSFPLDFNFQFKRDQEGSNIGLLSFHIRSCRPNVRREESPLIRVVWFSQRPEIKGDHQCYQFKDRTNLIGWAKPSALTLLTSSIPFSRSTHPLIKAQQ